MTWPAFLITVDTEGDNLWARPRVASTRNAAFLPRFQALCEKYHLKPTYLATWEMANCRSFQDFALDVLRREQGEVGMHLHAWDSPPIIPLTPDDALHHPYLIEYSVLQMRDKVRTLTDRLESVFHTKMVSHRAGRWAFNGVYARILEEAGYLVDCSVTPHVSWRSYLGSPQGRGGPDYTAFPDSAYFLNLDDVRRPGPSRLLEVPVTILSRTPLLAAWAWRALENVPLGKRTTKRFFVQPGWLRPNGTNRRQLLTVLSTALRQGRDYVQLVLHSSELMPGGSPKAQSPNRIERLYANLEVLFSAALQHSQGVTLQDFYRRKCDHADAGV